MRTCRRAKVCAFACECGWLITGLGRRWHRLALRPCAARLLPLLLWTELLQAAALQRPPRHFCSAVLVCVLVAVAMLLRLHQKSDCHSEALPSSVSHSEPSRNASSPSVFSRTQLHPSSFARSRHHRSSRYTSVCATYTAACYSMQRQQCSAAQDLHVRAKAAVHYQLLVCCEIARHTDLMCYSELHWSLRGAKWWHVWACGPDRVRVSKPPRDTEGVPPADCSNEIKFLMHGKKVEGCTSTMPPMSHSVFLTTAMSGAWRARGLSTEAELRSTPKAAGEYSSSLNWPPNLYVL